MTAKLDLGEVLYESETILICRGRRRSDHVPVVVKSLKQEHPKPTDVARLKYEHAVTVSLPLPGVVQTYGIEKLGNNLALIMEDCDGVALNQVISSPSLGLQQRLQIAVSLADTLGAIHQRGVIHMDVKPHNVIINLAKMEAKLTDFGSALYLSQELHGASHPSAYTGTLAYMSPEQTGRMNRVIDSRTDLYSLGVTIYELLTGVLPFRATDPMELVHSHIARVPPALKEVAPDVPQVLSDMVAKLLSKGPEDRYQSALGLKADLEQCLKQLESGKAIDAFPLGRYDYVDKLQIPQKLYGRERELSVLMEAWGRASRGAVELLLVSGYSGIGKSVLVYEIHKAIAESNGYFIAGKFDQLNRSIPYAAVAHAFRELIRSILTESEDALARWKSALQDALGANGKLIVDLIPELELLIGPQPNVPALPPTESQNRFNLVFQKFCRVFATEQHPLVLFLDDLQWADPASLKFIQHILTEADIGSMLVIGAYRDNEVDENHIFSLVLADLRKAKAAISGITLEPLNLPVARQIIADTLNTTPERVDTLAEIIFAKTRGNPFFMHQFMKALYADKLITFDAAARAWTWDLVRLSEMRVTDNVVDFMAGKLRRLAPGTQQVLKLAACIGYQFDLKTLSVIHGAGLSETVRDLWEALREGLILALDVESRFVHNAGEHEVIDAEIAANVSYRFLHDRVQQAAYSLVEEARLKELHLRIGRLMLERVTEDHLENELFDILGHLNLSQSLITAPDERLRLARLNLRAGRKAKLGLAYDGARNYFASGVALLGASRWDDEYEFSFALHSELAECESLIGQPAAAESLFGVLTSRAKSTLDKVHVLNLRMSFYLTLGKFLEAIQAALAALALLGIEIPEDNAQQDAMLNAEIAVLQQYMAGRKPADLCDLPLAVEPEQQAVLKLLADLSTPAFAINFKLGAIAIIAQINTSIKSGNSEMSAWGYMMYGTLLMAGMGRPEDAYAFAKLGIALNEKFNNVRLSCMLMSALSTMVHFFEPLRAALKWCSRTRQAGLESGDFPYLSYSCIHTVSGLLGLGEDLDSVRQENEQLLLLMQRTKDTFTTLVLTGARQVIENLTGRTESRLSWSNGSFDELAYASETEKVEFAYLACWYHSFKLQLSYLYGDYRGALTHMALAEAKTTPAQANVFFVTENQFFSALTLLAVFDAASAAEKDEYRSRLEGHVAKLATWAELCPSTYKHKHRLVMAEMARVSGEALKAMALYDEAIDAARENEFVRDEAIASEIAARYLLSQGRLRFARAYMTDAYHGYLRWGASAKADDLLSNMSQLISESVTTAALRDKRKPAGTVTASAHSETSASSSSAANMLDVEAVIRAAQTLAGEVVLGNVISRLMDIMLKNAGAQKGVLVLEEDGQLMLKASVTLDQARVGLSVPLSSSTELPLTIVQYVARTKGYVVIGDVAREPRFAADPYIVAHNPKSILCLAMAHQGRTTGIFYLENTAADEAFTPARVEILKLILVQAATAFENARLYTNLQSRTEALANTEAQLRHEFAERERSEHGNAMLQEEVIRVQKARLAELSTPLIPITDRIMVMPLIGMMDSQRAQQVLTTALQGVQANNAEVVIIEITGIKLVDTDVASTLIATANALRLLGAQAVITGIRPEVAQALVNLQVDFGMIVTKGTLQSGIAYALKRTGVGIRTR